MYKNCNDYEHKTEYINFSFCHLGETGVSAV